MSFIKFRDTPQTQEKRGYVDLRINILDYDYVGAKHSNL